MFHLQDNNPHKVAITNLGYSCDHYIFFKEPSPQIRYNIHILLNLVLTPGGRWGIIENDSLMELETVYQHVMATFYLSTNTYPCMVTPGKIMDYTFKEVNNPALYCALEDSPLLIIPPIDTDYPKLSKAMPKFIELLRKRRTARKPVLITVYNDTDQLGKHQYAEKLAKIYGDHAVKTLFNPYSGGGEQIQLLTYEDERRIKEWELKKL